MDVTGSLFLLAQQTQQPTVAIDWRHVGFLLGGMAAVSGLLLLFTYGTRSGIVARSATKEAIRQPVFALMLFVAIASLVINTFVPFFSLGEDVKMLKDCGLATIQICGLLMAVWTASTSVAAEIEGKTAMTLLSKPVNRRQFIVGKYVGILNAVLLLVVPAAICFLALIMYKVGYDAKESGVPQPEWWPDRVQVALQILPGVVLIQLEIAVLAAISTAISTRVPMVVNVVTCFAIFVVGHLTPMLVQTDVLRLEFVEFMAKLIATVLPSLEVFNIQAAVATDAVVPLSYLGYSLLYGAAYSGAAILLAFILFEDRDLA